MEVIRLFLNLPPGIPATSCLFRRVHSPPPSPATNHSLNIFSTLLEKLQ